MHPDAALDSQDRREGEDSRRALNEKGQKNLKDYLIRGILEEDFVAGFFASIRRVQSWNIPYASVVLSDKGITLNYNPGSFAEMNQERIHFTLSHELYHVLALHFIRGFDLMEELAIPVKEFYRHFAPFTDLPVNWACRDLPGYAMETDLLTYEKTGISQNLYSTYEAIVYYLYNNKEKHEQLKDQLGLNGLRVVFVNDNGDLVDNNGEPIPNQDGQGQDRGNTLVIPYLSPEGKREALNEIESAVQTAMKTAGTMSSNLREAVEFFMDIYRNSVIKGWMLVEKLLVGYRNNPKFRKRSFRRLNRRTMMVPGKVHDKMFRAMFIVDESGSMSDEEVDLGFALVKKACLRENSDKLFVVHYDTQPHEEIDEISNLSDLEKITRRKSGGTDFSEMFRHPNILMQDVDLMIIITDGEPCQWPDSAPKVPACWIVTTTHGYSSLVEEGVPTVSVCVAED